MSAAILRRMEEFEALLREWQANVFTKDADKSCCHCGQWLGTYRAGTPKAERLDIRAACLHCRTRVALAGKVAR